MTVRSRSQACGSDQAATAFSICAAYVAAKPGSAAKSRFISSSGSGSSRARRSAENAVHKIVWLSRACISQSGQGVTAVS